MEDRLEHSRGNLLIDNNDPVTVGDTLLLSSTILARGSQIDRALEHTTTAIALAMEGKLDPAIYVLSADCGCGKSATFCGYIRAWKADGFPGSGSILVCVATKDEIDNVRRRCGLDKDDFAIITADQAMNSYGLGRYNAQQAKVLFTTHEQYKRRLYEAGSFAIAEEFYYKGARRAVTIWDEGLDFAQPASFSYYALLSLPQALRRLNRDLADMIAGIIPNRTVLEPGYLLAVPADFAKPALALSNRPTLALDSDQKRALLALHVLAGGTAVARDGKVMGWQFVGAGNPLPDDIGPIVVLDASARLVPKYHQAAKAGRDIKFLPEARVSHERVTLHWWNRGAGKTVLTTPESRTEIYDVVGDLINADVSSEWLIIFAKMLREDSEDTGLPKELAARITNPANVHALTWGRHRALNDYRMIKKVIVIGALNYTDADYAAIVMAATGQRDTPVSDADVKATEDGEWKSNLYQGIGRTNMRNQEGGVAGEVDAYLIMPNDGDRIALASDAFAGCTIVPWQPVTKANDTKLEKAKAAIVRALATGSAVAIKDITEACGGKGKGYLTKVFSTADFKDWMIANGLDRNAHSIRRTAA